MNEQNLHTLIYPIIVTWCPAPVFPVCVGHPWQLAQTLEAPSAALLPQC